MAVTMTTSRSQGPLRSEYYTRRQLAEELGMSARTLDRWHAHREGPPRISMGKLVFYRREAVREWLASLEVQPVATGSTDTIRA